MATGLTYPILDGRVTTFKQFAKNCAKQMGAFGYMRDDNGDAPPRLQTERTYYAESLAKAWADLEKFESSTVEERLALYEAWVSAREKTFSEISFSQAENFRRLSAMKADIEAYVPPTLDHQKFKEFMLEQVVSTIRIDCYRLFGANERPTFVEWEREKSAQLHRAVTNAEESLAAHRKNIQECNEWICLFFQSIGEEPPK